MLRQYPVHPNLFHNFLEYCGTDAGSFAQFPLPAPLVALSVFAVKQSQKEFHNQQLGHRFEGNDLEQQIVLHKLVFLQACSADRHEFHVYRKNDLRWLAGPAQVPLADQRVGE